MLLLIIFNLILLTSLDSFILYFEFIFVDFASPVYCNYAHLLCFIERFETRSVIQINKN